MRRRSRSCLSSGITPGAGCSSSTTPTASSASCRTMPRWLRFIDRFRKSRREAKALHPLLARMLAERREPGYRGPQDLLWRLANARDRQTGESLSIAELEDEVLTLGSTSVTSLQAYSWIWYLLALHPWAEARVEADR